MCLICRAFILLVSKVTILMGAFIGLIGRVAADWYGYCIDESNTWFDWWGFSRLVGLLY